LLQLVLDKIKLNMVI